MINSHGSRERLRRSDSRVVEPDASPSTPATPGHDFAGRLSGSRGTVRENADAREDGMTKMKYGSESCRAAGEGGTRL